MKKELFTFAFLAALLAGALLVAGLGLAFAQPLPCPVLFDLPGYPPGSGPPLLGAAGMIVNAANLRVLFTGYKAAFNTGFRTVAPMWQRVATLVPSATAEEKYGWLGQFPKLREWLGDRHIKGMELHDYAIKNKDYESTIGVDRNRIEDDTYGVMAPMFEEMGFAASQHPDELVWPLLKDGFAQLCYDGQPFFDADHPVAGASVSNTGGGAGTPWFLLDVSRPLKPLLFQKRKDYNLLALTREDDEAVFMRKEYRYGVDARANVGFGFWQQAYGSKQALDKAAYAAARAAMMEFKSDEGRPLAIKPNLLVVPPALEAAALEILNSERDAAGATNVWRGTAELLVMPHLA